MIYRCSKVRVGSSPRANGILDTVVSAHVRLFRAPPDSEAQSARQAHGFRLPSELLEMSTLRALEDAVVAEWFSGYTSPRYARLAIGPLFGELSLKLKESAAAQDPCRILVWSGHDTSLGGIL